MSKLPLLIVSHVLPYPGTAGQQQRVRNKLRALRRLFEITFLTYAPPSQIEQTKRSLLEYVDRPIVLPSRTRQSTLLQLNYKFLGKLYTVTTGLKASNYILGNVELNRKRIAEACTGDSFAIVVYEYWHAHKSTAAFRSRGIPCVLDMHDILWQSFTRQLESKKRLPRFWKNYAARQYKRNEERAWQYYDALISINVEEGRYAREVVGQSKPIFYAPMGVDLEQWPYCWSPENPPRIAYYGGLGNVYNQQEALRCYERIMPQIWRKNPDTELWLIGSNPPEALKSLSSHDRRVTVTGYVERVQDTLKTISAVLCPFSATFGFRSRLVEVMATGVPVIATPEAVYGMEMEHGKGIFLTDDDSSFASQALSLLKQPDWAKQQSNLARQQVEEKFGFEATYGRLARDLYQFAENSVERSG